MVANLRLIGIRCMKLLLYVLYIFPLKRNFVMFCSYDGKSYACNPKYIYEYMKKNCRGYKYIWVFNDQKDIPKEINEEIIVKFKSLKYYYYLAITKVYINNGIAPAYFPFRKSQIVIGTWHGGGAYKKGGISVTKTKSYIETMKLISQNATYVLSSSERFSKILKKSFLIPESKIIKCGMPRNDIMFQNEEKIKKKVKGFFGIPEEGHIILYAPTFRSTIASVESGFSQGDYLVDIKKLKSALEKRFGGTWFVLFRTHYYLCFVDMENVISATEYPDMQELLLAADVLLNDYSSSMWDFSLKVPHKPCFIYADDWKKYDSERGFEMPIQEWPFPLSASNDELYQNILNFNQAEYEKAVDRHLQTLGSYENGKATEIVTEIIEKACR